MMFRTGFYAAILSLLIYCNAASAASFGWELKGDAPKNYAWGVQSGEKHEGHNIAFLKYEKASTTEGFGTLMQTFAADNYRGKRVKFSGFLKTKDVALQTGLWMRVDGIGGKLLSFDNMGNRLIKGSNDWQNVSVVLDVPPGAIDIACGAMLTGTGEIWISGLKFEEVGKDVPTTGTPTASLPEAPVDLDFGNSK